MPVGEAAPPADDYVLVRGINREFKNLRRFCRANLTFSKKSEIAKILRFTPETHNAVAGTIADLNMPERFCAVHVRWGDKLIHDADQFYASDYLKHLPATCRDLFVLTDDCRAIEGFRGKGLRLHTLVTNEQMGHSTLKRRKRRFSRSELIQLLAEVQVAGSADFFVGTMSSNLSRYVALLHSNLSNCMSLDRGWHPL